MADMFAGCGGFSLGMEKAGFTPWFVNEIEPITNYQISIIILETYVI